MREDVERMTVGELMAWLDPHIAEVANDLSPSDVFRWLHDTAARQKRLNEIGR